MKMLDVMIGLADKSQLYFVEADVSYYPNAAYPRAVHITTQTLAIAVPYHSVDFIADGWSNRKVNNER